MKRGQSGRPSLADRAAHFPLDATTTQRAPAGRGATSQSAARRRGGASSLRGATKDGGEGVSGAREGDSRGHAPLRQLQRLRRGPTRAAGGGCGRRALRQHAAGRSAVAHLSLWLSQWRLRVLVPAVTLGLGRLKGGASEGAHMLRQRLPCRALQAKERDSA